MHKTEFTRYHGTRDIMRITMYFYPLHLIDNKGHFSQCGAHLSRQSLLDVPLVNPVTDLAHVRPQAGMQACATEHLCFIRVKNPIDIIPV